MKAETVMCKAFKTEQDDKPLFDIPNDVVKAVHANAIQTLKGPNATTPSMSMEVLSTTETHEVKRYRYGTMAFCDVISLLKPSSEDVERATPCALGDGVTACIAAHVAVTMGRTDAFYYIHSLYVAEEFRGTGVGRKLLAFVLNQIGPNWVWLCSQADGGRSIDTDNQRRLFLFYEDFGFRRLHVASRLMSLTPNYTAGRASITLDPSAPPTRHPWDKEARTIVAGSYSVKPDFKLIKESLLKVVDGEDPGVLVCDKVEALLELPKGTIQLLKAGRINMIVNRIGRQDVKTALDELANSSDPELAEAVARVSLADYAKVAESKPEHNCPKVQELVEPRGER